MRNLNLLNRFRLTDKHVLEQWGWIGDETAGMFMVPSPIDQKPLAVVASNGEGWDHVSVSRLTRCPNWPEMEFVAKLFFEDDECAMQLHVPESNHVNNHPFCLHWWRPHAAPIPLPDPIMVGIRDAGVLDANTARLMREQVNRLVERKFSKAGE